MSVPALEIIRARPQDVPAIMAMIHEMAEFEKLTHLLQASEQDLAADLFSERPAVECVVAVRNGEPLAYAMYFHNYSSFLTKKGLYLEDIYVRASVRGQDIGKALLVHLAGLAHQRGCARFEWSVLDWNENAIRFYESLGATVMPEWRICRVTGAALDQMAGLAAA